MRQSKLFTKTRKEAPADEVAKNAELLIRGGYINKEMAGVYDYLPLGLRVLKKIENIIREEMNAIGGQEIFLSALQDPEIWKKTDRWSDEKIDNWFKTSSKWGGEYGLSFTHEEPITTLMKNHVNSYKDLPFAAYQLQTKFRDEKRAKSGILRGREFIMKDLYSFHVDEVSLNDFYDKAANAYKNIFSRCGIGEITYMTFASGGAFSKYSHEFQTLCEAGEDKIFIDEEKKIVINEEVLSDEVISELGLNKENLREEKSIEVGNIFKLGTKFSEALGLSYKDQSGESKPVIMGSYGIGPGRLMGTVVETHHDDKGIIWPEEIAPFRVHLLELSGEKPEVKQKADEIYDQLSKKYEVLYDDRDLRAGEKFADADLLGTPLILIVGEKGLSNGELELKTRKTGESRNIKIGEIDQGL